MNQIELQIKTLENTDLRGDVQSVFVILKSDVGFLLALRSVKSVYSANPYIVKLAEGFLDLPFGSVLCDNESYGILALHLLDILVA